MSILRKAIVSGLTMLILALAGPALAQPQKIFSLKVSATGNPLEYQALFKNETPNGNSTINSIILMAPAGTVITNAVPQNGDPTITGIGSNTINVANMPGIKAGGNTWYLTITLSAASPPCIAWNARAFTGNSFGGTEFALLPPPASILTINGPAPGCLVTLTMAPGTVNQGTNGVAMTATFANPAANAASFSAFTLTAPAGITIASVTPPTGTTWTASALPGGAVTVTNISPAVAPGANLVATLSVNTAGSCTTTNVNWAAVVYAGPAASGPQFGLSGSSSLGTQITGANCSLTFSPDPPQNGIQGKTLPPVSVVVNGGPGGTVVLSSGNCGQYLSGTLSRAGSIGSPAVFNDLVISNFFGSCTFTASIQNNPAYQPVTSKSFTVFQSGPINCEGQGNNTFDASVGGMDVNHTGYFNGLRGTYNKDGSPCANGGIGFTATNDIANNNQVTFQWDTAADPGAAFEYTVTWKPEYVNPATGMPSRTTKVQWFVNGVLTAPAIGRACIAQNANGNPVTYLPAPYGTLSGGIDAVTTTLTVSASTTIPTPPFAITIGTERLLVSVVAGSTWTVARGDGGTTAAPHSGGAFVMSNPLPLDGAGMQMRVCIAEEGFTIVPPGANDCPTSTTVNPNPLVTIPTVPTACVLYSTTVYDIGDGAVGRSP